MIRTETRDGVEILTLDRPERRNALVPELMAAAAEQLQRCSQRPDLRGIVLTGAGPAFCVGADLKWLAEGDPGAGVATLVHAYHDVIRAVRAAPAPVIAAVNGAAAGGGMGLALAADYRVASPNATFTAAYFRLGLTPDGGNSAFLVRMIGAARAMELLLTNRSLSAEQASAWGLVGEVVPPESLLDRAREHATGLRRLPPEALLATRRLLDVATTQPLTAQLDAEAEAISTAAQSERFRQAIEAFLGRRGAG